MRGTYVEPHWPRLKPTYSPRATVTKPSSKPCLYTKHLRTLVTVRREQTMGDEDERKHFDEQLSRAVRLTRGKENPYLIKGGPDIFQTPSERRKAWSEALCWLDEYGAKQRREREQLRRLLDKHEDWIVEEIDRRKKERERKAGKEAQPTSHVEPPQWEPPPRVAPPTGWREPTNPPWYRADLDDLQQRLDRANGPYQVPEEGWD